MIKYLETSRVTKRKVTKPRRQQGDLAPDRW